MQSDCLQLKSVKTESRTLSLVNRIEEEIENNFDHASIVAYRDNGVWVGFFKNHRIRFYDNSSIDLKYIRKLRVFNDSRELLCWRASDYPEGLRGRIRIDEQGGTEQVIDAYQMLIGTREDKARHNAQAVGFKKITEDRGGELILPFPDLEVDAMKRVFIKTRNYIGYNELSQAGYIDCRFKGFFTGDGSLENMEALSYG